MMKDLTDENITPNAILVNSSSPNHRLNFILSSLITHLHDFARETRLTTEEWRSGIEFLTATGKACSDTRQEFILLSDILGLSTLVESIAHPKPPGATEGTVLGPFHTHDAQEKDLGESIASSGKGETCLFRGTVKDLSGNPIAGAKIDVWETDDTGHYDTQYESRDGPDCRGILTSGSDGHFWFKAVKPVPYPIPHDGPVGTLLKELHRHPYRPSHMHFLINASGYDTLVTALYARGDPYETTDAVFGVKSSLVVDFVKVEDSGLLQKYGLEKGAWGLQYDFVLVDKREAELLGIRKTEEASEKLRARVKLAEGLPVLDVD